MSSLTRLLRALWSRHTPPEDDFPLYGFTTDRVATPRAEALSDEELQRLNALLPWSCFTVDTRGRRLGNRAWPGKREEPQAVPDRRIVQMNGRFGIAGKHVLEFGCFEGVHTAGLCRLGAKVTAIDARIENVVKTLVRTAMFGCAPEVYVCNVDEPDGLARLPRADLIHHVGVLYHLKDPVTHLISLGRHASEGIMLDSHFAWPDSARHEYRVAGRVFRYRHYQEGGQAEAFSGMYDHAKWLLLDDIKLLLREAGFPRIEVVEERNERNGPRVLLFASRT